MIKFKISGLEKLQKKLNSIDLDKIVNEELELAGQGAVGDAKQKCISSSVSSSIGVDIKDKSVTLYATDKVAPYIEFGTGTRVFETTEFNFTPEMKEYARRFFVNGQGYLPAHPFLFPAGYYNYKQAVKNIISTLKKEIKK